MDEREGAWQADVESWLREVIARALEGTAQQILHNGVPKPLIPKTPKAPPPGPGTAPADGQPMNPWPEPQGPGSGPTRGQILEVIRRHMAQGQEHFTRDGRPLSEPGAVLEAMEQDGFVIVGHRVTLPAGYQGT